MMQQCAVAPCRCGQRLDLAKPPRHRHGDDTLKHSRSTLNATTRQQLRQKEPHTMGLHLKSALLQTNRKRCWANVASSRRARTDGSAHLIIDQVSEVVARVDHEVEHTTDVSKTMLPPLVLVAKDGHWAPKPLGASHDSPRAQTCTSEGPGAANTKIHEKTSKRKMNENCGGRRKKGRNCGWSCGGRSGETAVRERTKEKKKEQRRKKTSKHCTCKFVGEGLVSRPHLLGEEHRRLTT